MIQVWKIDNKGFYTGESTFMNIKDVTQLDVKIGFTTGYVKPIWDGISWSEGATDEEIKAYEDENKEVVEISDSERMELLESENADLLLDSVKKDIRIEQNELDIADLLLAIGGM